MRSLHREEGGQVGDISVKSTAFLLSGKKAKAFMSLLYIVSVVMCVHVGESARLECEKSQEFKQGSDLFFRVSLQRCVQTMQPALPALSLSRPGSGGRASTGVCAIYADSHLRLHISIRERQFTRVCILALLNPCETDLEQDHRFLLLLLIYRGVCHSAASCCARCRFVLNCLMFCHNI